MEKSIKEVLGPNNICVIVSEFILTPWKEYIYLFNFHLLYKALDKRRFSVIAFHFETYQSF